MCVKACLGRLPNMYDGHGVPRGPVVGRDDPREETRQELQRATSRTNKTLLYMCIYSRDSAK